MTEATERFEIIPVGKTLRVFRVTNEQHKREAGTEFGLRYTSVGAYKKMDTILKKYPTATMPEHESWMDMISGSCYYRTTSMQYNDPSVFPFGRYKGQPIAKCDNLDYLEWFKTVCNSKTVVNMINIQINAIMSGKVNEQKVIASQGVDQRIKIESLKMQATGKVTVKFNTNVILWSTNDKAKGHIVVNGQELKDFVVFVHFANGIQVYDYCGFSYGYPCDKKGKGKRIKNKTLELDVISTERTVDETRHDTNEKNLKDYALLINVGDFKILK